MSDAPAPEFQFPLSWTGPDGIGASPFDEFAEAEQPDVGGDDPALALRKTLGMFATGVTVITTLKGEQVHGMTANAFMSVSLEPPLVLISVDRGTKMCGMLHEGSHYGVSVLCESQAKLSDRFAGRPCEDCPAPRFDLVRETPLVDGALDGPRCKILGHRLVIERRLPSGSYQAPQAFPPHVGLLAL